VTADKAASVARLVVVIDSHRLVLEATAGLLGSWGYEVIEAGSYLGAVEAIARHRRRPDLIVCDSELPWEESGLEVVQRLRATLGSDIPAVLIGADVKSRSRRIGAGHDRLLEQPVDAETLRMTLLDIIGPGAPNDD
jgi:two-component system, sensor histidine kinase